MKSSDVRPLKELAERASRDFPHIFAARERTSTGLVDKRASLEPLRHSPGASIVLMGSWGRAEVTSGSDDDFMVLLRGAEDLEVLPTIDEVSKVLDHSPSEDGPFASPVFSQKLVHQIGLDGDDNKNLTRRLLFLLESTPVTGEEVYGAVRDEILDRYMDGSVKPYRPPRFLLNDVVRYWRTICVDFAAKEWKGPEKWGIRNAKLRTSRKILFAGGLLPVLECSRFEVGPMRVFLEEERGRPPTDRIARAFLENDASDEGARTLGAYDEFVGRMHQSDFRQKLESLTRDTAKASAAFAEVEQIGKEIQAGLLALLHEASPQLAKVVRDYAIF
ncbi:MAG TPA: hypothetical protein VF085_03400 [Solirubrobacterales bacterium]